MAKRKLGFETECEVCWLVNSIKDLQKSTCNNQLRKKFKDVEKNFLILKRRLFGE